MESVNILNLQNLFNNPIQYEIPPLQRKYVWDQEQQWDPLWNDVRNTAEDYLVNGTHVNKHFLGAIVIQQQRHSVNMLDTRQVVDGQQRLITTQLLLDATQEVFEERNVGNPAKRLSRLVLNGEEFQDENSYSAFKVLPTIDDRKAFRHAMSNEETSDEFEETLIVQAHEFFKLMVRDWLDQRPEESDQRVDALEITIRNLLEMVVIDLKQSDNPHVIFETLNARGTPLLESDKVKNMMLFEAGKVDIGDPDQIWDFGGKWWNEEVYQGRLLRPRVDAFLNFWLIMRKLTEVAPSNVFADFRRYFAEEGKRDAEAVAADIEKVGKVYAALEKVEVDDGIELFLYRRGVMQAGVITPVLMWLLSSGVPPEQITTSLQALESYLVRRMVCGMTTRGYNRLFIGILSALDSAGAARSGEAITQYLKGQESYATQWPDDQQLRDAFLHRPVYRLMTRGRTRIVLERIEAGLRTDKAGDQSVPRDLTIEHVMPRGWRSDWKLPSDVEDEEMAKSNRDRLIHTMGNLTLARSSLNTSLSNRPWEEKREELHDHITLFLNKDLVKEPVWNEERIEARAHQLAQVAIKVWPHAAGMQASSQNAPDS